RFSRDWSSDVCSSDLIVGQKYYQGSKTYSRHSRDNRQENRFHQYLKLYGPGTFAQCTPYPDFLGPFLYYDQHDIAHPYYSRQEYQNTYKISNYVQCPEKALYPLVLFVQIKMSYSPEIFRMYLPVLPHHLKNFFL